MAGNYSEYRTRQEMVEHGWKLNPLNSECRNCHAEITWATTPSGKKIPLDINSTVMHFKTCSNGGAPAASSRTTTATTTTPTTNTNETAALRESLDECAQAVRELCRILRARAEAR